MLPDSLGERLAEAVGSRNAVLTFYPDEEPPPPVMLARYEVLARVGEGGMNMVFEARDPELDRRVAIKACKAATREAAALIEHEARSLAKLEHPNVVQVFDVVREGSDVAIVMQFIEGETLRAWQLRTRPDWREVIACYVQAAEALAAVHLAGLEHADFKPDNVLVDSQGRVRVIDFGIGLHSSQPDEPHEPDDQPDERPNVGTREYMAPERLMDRPGGVRADVYAFCVSMWESLFGVRPFGRPEHPTTIAMLAAIEADKPRKGTRPSDMPPVVRNVLRKGLAWEPSDRHASMEAVLSALLKSMRDDPPAGARKHEHSGRGRGWRGSLRTILLVLGCVGATVLVMREPERSLAEQRLELAHKVAVAGNPDEAVDLLGAARLQARRDHDDVGKWLVIVEAIRVGAVLLERGDREAARASWDVGVGVAKEFDNAKGRIAEAHLQRLIRGSDPG
jgi:predicted Ser/Thr protein kinase